MSKANWRHISSSCHQNPRYFLLTIQYLHAIHSCTPFHSCTSFQSCMPYCTLSNTGRPALIYYLAPVHSRPHYYRCTCDSLLLFPLGLCFVKVSCAEKIGSSEVNLSEKVVPVYSRH